MFSDDETIEKLREYILADKVVSAFLMLCMHHQLTGHELMELLRRWRDGR